MCKLDPVPHSLAGEFLLDLHNIIASLKESFNFSLIEKFDRIIEAIYADFKPFNETLSLPKNATRLYLLRSFLRSYLSLPIYIPVPIYDTPLALLHNEHSNLLKQLKSTQSISLNQSSLPPICLSVNVSVLDPSGKHLFAYLAEYLPHELVRKSSNVFLSAKAKQSESCAEAENNIRLLFTGVKKPSLSFRLLIIFGQTCDEPMNLKASSIEEVKFLRGYGCIEITNEEVASDSRKPLNPKLIERCLASNDVHQSDEITQIKVFKVEPILYQVDEPMIQQQIATDLFHVARSYKLLPERDWLNFTSEKQSLRVSWPPCSNAYRCSIVRRNELQFRLSSGTFIKVDKRAEFNAEVHITLCDADGKEVTESCYRTGDDSCWSKTENKKTHVIYHCNTPTWDHTFSVGLPVPEFKYLAASSGLLDPARLKLVLKPSLQDPYPMLVEPAMAEENHVNNHKKVSSRTVTASRK
ncbi:hypothetical protein Ciccas_000953 [Cichlidogyrus casuarinus]|uniref:C2 DOCK-type domain-containing protein n=1 Tax=Cichlidogyrus casuarinus TaxID=1844966 RepID=A0ABD2QLF4_9PLAT